LIPQPKWSTTKETGETAQGAVLLKAWLSTICAASLLVTCAIAPAKAAANAGQTYGSSRNFVSGVVTSEGANTPSMVRVELRTVAGGIIQTVYTDDSGQFTFNNVPPGSYSLVVRMPGFEPIRMPLRVDLHPVMNLVLTLTPTKFGQRNAKAVPGSANVVSVRQLQIPGKAIEEYRKAAESESRGKTDEAIHHWEKAVKIYPKFAESYIQLSRIYADRGDFEKATQSANNALDIDGTNADSYVALGYVYMKEKDTAKATEALQKAVRLSDSNWFSQLWLGKLLLDEKQAQDAYPHLLRASELKPDLPTVYLLLYNDLLGLDRAKDALAKLDEFLDRFPDNPMAEKARAKRQSLAKALAQKNGDH
jgi:tetratricopeptide (TPR) repeat protein